MAPSVAQLVIFRAACKGHGRSGMRRTRRLSAATRDALAVLGGNVTVARRRQRRTAAEVAERAGVSVHTLRKVERGDPTVALGTALEIAALLGVPLVAEDQRHRRLIVENVRLQAALLPSRIPPASPVDNDF